MANLIKKIKIKKQDGTFTDYIPIGAEAQNVDCSDGESVEYKLNHIFQNLKNLDEISKSVIKRYNTFPDISVLESIPNNTLFCTNGYYTKEDGNEGIYIKTT